MKVELEKSFPMPASADAVWAFLQDIEAVAGCMPGAKITERVDPSRFKGTVTVKLGPATMTFRGEVEVRDIDQTARSLRLLGKGTDSTGTSGAAMDLRARIEGTGAGASTLLGKSEVSTSGKAATFGGRMMNSIADQILKQFADNFAKRVATLAAHAAAAAPAQPADTVPPAQLAHGVPPAQSADKVPPPTQRAGQSRTSGAPAAPAVQPAVPAAAPAPPAAASAANELNGLSLAWAVLKDWLRSLFSRKTA